MTERRSADIIPFPVPARPAGIGDPAAAPAVAPESDAGARLRIALIALDAALNAQRTAVAGWRAALNELRGNMRSLGRSLHGYQDSLGTLGHRVQALGTTARQREARGEATRDPPVA